MLTTTLQSSQNLFMGCVDDMDLPVPHRPPMDAPIQQVEGVHVPEEAKDAVTEGVASEMQTGVQSYQSRVSNR